MEAWPWPCSVEPLFPPGTFGLDPSYSHLMPFGLKNSVSHLWDGLRREESSSIPDAPLSTQHCSGVSQEHTLVIHWLPGKDITQIDEEPVSLRAGEIQILTRSRANLSSPSLSVHDSEMRLPRAPCQPHRTVSQVCERYCYQKLC